MNHIIKKTGTLALAGVAAAGLFVGSAWAELYKVTSIAPGMSPFVVNTAIATSSDLRIARLK